MRERPLFLTIRPPGPRSFVGRKNMIHERRDRICEGNEESESEEDGKRLGRNERMSKKAVPGFDQAWKRYEMTYTSFLP